MSAPLCDACQIGAIATPATHTDGYGGEYVWCCRHANHSASGDPIIPGAGCEVEPLLLTPEEREGMIHRAAGLFRLRPRRETP